MLIIFTCGTQVLNSFLFHPNPFWYLFLLKLTPIASCSKNLDKFVFDFSENVLGSKFSHFFISALLWDCSLCWDTLTPSHHGWIIFSLIRQKIQNQRFFVGKIKSRFYWRLFLCYFCVQSYRNAAEIQSFPKINSYNLADAKTTRS